MCLVTQSIQRRIREIASTDPYIAVVDSCLDVNFSEREFAEMLTEMRDIPDPIKARCQNLFRDRERMRKLNKSL